MSACAKAGKWKKALELLDEMETARPPVTPNTVCYSAVISAFATAGEWGRAVELLDVMAARGVPPNDYCYSAVISACAHGGEWEQAVGFIDTIKVGWGGVGDQGRTVES